MAAKSFTLEGDTARPETTFTPSDTREPAPVASPALIADTVRVSPDALVGPYSVASLTDEVRHFLDRGELMPLPYDEAPFRAEQIASGATADDLTQGEENERLQRLRLCAYLQRYIDAVRADETRRDVDVVSTETSDGVFVPAGAPPAFTSATAQGATPAATLPDGISSGQWARARRFDHSRMIAWYEGAHPTDRGRLFDSLFAARQRANDSDSDKSERENARLIALEAAYDLAYEARIAADPSIELEWTFGGIIDNIARVYDLTSEEAAAVEVAANALLALPRIPYRQPRDGDTTETAQEAPAAAEDVKADTRAVTAKTVVPAAFASDRDEAAFFDAFHSMPPTGRDAMELMFRMIARGNLTPEKAATALRVIDQVKQDEQERQQEGGAA